MARTVNHEQHRQRRASVVRTAASLFARQGFAKTTTAEIARAAGMSAGSLFYYFPDKPAIFRAIFEEDIPHSRQLIDAHQHTTTPVASILEIVEQLATPARDELAPGLLVELVRQAGEDPLLVDIVEANDQIVQDGLAGLVGQAAADGHADPNLDAAEAARWIRILIDAVFLNSGNAPATDPLPMLRLIITRYLRLDDPAHDAPHYEEHA